MRSVFRNMFVRVSMLVLVVFCLVAFVTLRLKQNDLYAKERALQAEIDRMNEYINELQYQPYTTVRLDHV